MLAAKSPLIFRYIILYALMPRNFFITFECSGCRSGLVRVFDLERQCDLFLDAEIIDYAKADLGLVGPGASVVEGEELLARVPGVEVGHIFQGHGLAVYEVLSVVVEDLALAGNLNVSYAIRSTFEVALPSQREAYLNGFAGPCFLRQMPGRDAEVVRLLHMYAVVASCKEKWAQEHGGEDHLLYFFHAGLVYDDTYAECYERVELTRG